MNLEAERLRIQAKADYGVKVNRDWARYHEERERQMPRLVAAERIAGNILLWTFTALFWGVLVGLPIYQWIKGG